MTASDGYETSMMRAWREGREYLAGGPRPPTELPSEIFRRQLKEVRKDRGLSQSALADLVKDLGGSLHDTAITRIEKGTRSVSLDEAMLLAAALNVAPAYLFAPRRDEPWVRLTDHGAGYPPVYVRRWFRAEGPLFPPRGPDDDVREMSVAYGRAHRQFAQWQPDDQLLLADNRAWKAAHTLLYYLGQAILGIPADTHWFAKTAGVTDEELAERGFLDIYLQRAVEDVTAYIQANRKELAPDGQPGSAGSRHTPVE